MECLRNCCFQNADTDFDIYYDSDSSVGLAATDNESSPNDTYDNDSEKSNNNNNNNKNHICNQCGIHLKTIIELRTMLMETKRDNLITIKELKKKYNKLLFKYKEKKELLNQFAISHENETEKIENIMNEMERLSANNSQILSEKHNIEREKDEIQNENLNLQLEINTHNQTLHEMTIKNDKITEEYRKNTTKLLKELNDIKQENMSYLYKMQSTNNIWANFDDIKPLVTRSRSRSAPEHSDQSDESVSIMEDINNNNINNNNNNNNNDNNNNDNNNDMLKLIQAQSLSLAGNELPSIDEQKEDATLIQRQGSISSDGTYDYEDNELSQNDINGPQFVIRSESQQSLSFLQERSYESYQSYHNITPKLYSFSNKHVSFSNNSGLDTPVSPLTVVGAGNSYNFEDEIVTSKKLGKIVSGNSIYVDTNGIDVTDDNEESKGGNDYQYEHEINDDDIKVNIDTGINHVKTVRIVNEKLQIVSFENEKLKQKIKELMIQLESK